MSNYCYRFHRFNTPGSCPLRITSSSTRCTRNEIITNEYIYDCQAIETIIPPIGWWRCSQTTYNLSRPIWKLFKLTVIWKVRYTLESYEELFDFEILRIIFKTTDLLSWNTIQPLRAFSTFHFPFFPLLIHQRHKTKHYANARCTCISFHRSSRSSKSFGNFVFWYVDSTVVSYRHGRYDLYTWAK